MKKCAMSSGLCPDYTKARAPSGVTCRTLFNYLERANNGLEAVAYLCRYLDFPSWAQQKESKMLEMHERWEFGMRER